MEVVSRSEPYVRVCAVESRIVMAADAFAALTHERPYKRAMKIDDAFAEMRKQAGTFFDPWIRTAFERLDHRKLI